MVVLRPFRVGDTVTVAGVTGTIVEIGLLTTTLNTFDHVKTIIGNNRIVGETIQNYDANSYRRVEVEAQLSTSTDVREAVRLFREKLDAMPNVLKTPPPLIEILRFNLAGPVVCVRPYAAPEHFWEVYFATNAMIRETVGDAGFMVPGTHLHVANHDAAVAAANQLFTPR